MSRQLAFVLGLCISACRSAAPEVNDAPAPIASSTPFDPGAAPEKIGDFKVGLYVVAEGQDLRAKFARGGSGLRLIYGSKIFDAERGDLVRVEPMSRGDAAFYALAVSSSGFTVASTGKALLAFEAGAWKEIAVVAPREAVYALTPFRGGALALVGAKHSVKPEYRFILHGSPESPPPAPTINEVADLIGFETGDLVAIADEKIERWTPGATQSVVETPPNLKDHDSVRLRQLCGRNASDVWVGGFHSDKHAKQRPYIAHFDGRSWIAHRYFGEGAVAAMAMGSDGSLWFATKMVYRRFPDGTWTNFSLPQSREVIDQNAWLEPDGLRVVGDRELWVTERHGYRQLVAHTQPGRGVLDLDDGTRITFASAHKRWILPSAPPDTHFAPQ